MEINNNNISYFNYICSELVSKILENVENYETLLICETVSVLWKKVLDEMQGYAIQKENFFVEKLMPTIKFFPPELIDALGGKKKIFQLPFINLNSPLHSYRFMEPSFNPEDLLGYDIGRGEKNGCPFIIFAYYQINPTIPVNFGTQVKVIHKLAGEGNTWISVGDTRDFHYNSQSQDKDEIELRLKNLFKNKIEHRSNTITVLGSQSQ